MDSVSEDEIEGIWGRVKVYIDVKNIRSISSGMIVDEIENEMRTAVVPAGREEIVQANMDFLIERGFPEQAAENASISSEILLQRISSKTVRGKTRFQITKGTPTFGSIKAGQFIKGKTKEEAVRSLKIKVERNE